MDPFENVSHGLRTILNNLTLGLTVGFWDTDTFVLMQRVGSTRVPVFIGNAEMVKAEYVERVKDAHMAFSKTRAANSK